MKKINQLSRIEMKMVLGGLRAPDQADPEDEEECMTHSTGDACGSEGGQCISIRNKIPREGFHLICRTLPDIPEPVA